MRWSPPTAAVLLGLMSFVCACTRTDPGTSPGVRSEASDDERGVELVTRVDSDEILLADRVWVEDTARWAGDLRPIFEAREWDAAGWTTIELVLEPPELRAGVYTLRRRTLVEPFLPGDYQIPPCVLRVPDATTEPALLSTGSIPVRVVGVLGASDSGELSPIPELGTVPEEERASPAPLLVGIAVASVLAGLGVLTVMRIRHGEVGIPSPIEELGRIEQDDEASERESYQRLGRVLDALDPTLRATSEIERMIRVCDQARYSEEPMPGQGINPRMMAAHARRLLAPPHSSSRGGHA